MKKQFISMAVGATAAGVIALLGATQAAFGVSDVPYVLKARSYKTFMVRAMDQCDPSTISAVGFPVEPNGGCLQTNIVTDEVPPTDPLGATLKFARVAVTKFRPPQGKVRLFGSGFQPGQRIRVQLTLRTTHVVAKVKHLPGPGKNLSVTFEDVTIQCGTDLPMLPCFSASQGGRIAKSMTLQQCLTNNGESTGFSKGQVEIVDAALVNCDTGKILARPGILNQ